MAVSGDGKPYGSEEPPELFDYPSATRKREEEGMVVAVRGEIAQVLLRRSRVCEGCGSCCVLVDEENMLAEAVNRAGARKGDRVLVDLPASVSIKAAYVLYGIPLVAFLAGFGIGALVASLLFGGSYGVPVGLIFAFVFLAVSYILLSRVYAPDSRAASRYRLVVTKVLSYGDRSQD